MERINQIITNQKYLQYIEDIKKYEKDRKFCRHDVSHFLDVCRLAENEWLYVCITEMKNEHNGKVEYEKIPGSKIVNKEFLYAAGLLHDIGRWQQYESGIPHEIASAKLAPEILTESGFSAKETEEIVEAIRNHRNSDVKEHNNLSGFLYRADKKSRPCFLCEVQKQCNWPVTKKNLEIR